MAAQASVNPDAALRAYAMARFADGDGALGMAVAGYREALKQDPGQLDIARRAYIQALESGDRALALRSAVLLDQAGALPRDGTLLLIGEALGRRDWTAASSLTDRLVEEGNFAFIGPMLQSWISLGRGAYVAPTLSGKDKFAGLAQRYIDEQIAMQALARKDMAAAAPALIRAVAARPGDSAALRITLAAQLSALGDRDGALALMPDKDANFAVARAAILKKRKPTGKIGAPMEPAQGYARLLSRLATDIAADNAGGALALRLTRIATFTDPNGEEVHLAAARLLTGSGHVDGAVAEARLVSADGWYGALGQAELIDALAASGERDAALVLARAQTAIPGAGPDRYVRLGRLLADMQDFNGAATSFRAAQALYPEGKAPWSLLLFEGSALEQGEQWDAARAVLERAAKIAPDEPIILNYLGYAQIERRQNVDAALALLKKASALKPQDASITDSLGWAQFVTGDVDAAVPVLEKAAAGAPADPTINEHLGDALWSAGRRYEARYAWEAAAVFAEGDVAQRLTAKRTEGWKPEYAAP